MILKTGNEKKNARTLLVHHGEWRGERACTESMDNIDEQAN